MSNWPHTHRMQTFQRLHVHIRWRPTIFWSYYCPLHQRAFRAKRRNQRSESRMMHPVMRTNILPNQNPHILAAGSRLSAYRLLSKCLFAYKSVIGNLCIHLDGHYIMHSCDAIGFQHVYKIRLGPNPISSWAPICYILHVYASMIKLLNELIPWCQTMTTTGGFNL